MCHFKKQARPRRSDKPHGPVRSYDWSNDMKAEWYMREDGDIVYEGFAANYILAGE